MARTNQKPQTKTTFEGAKAYHLTPEQELRRSVMACLLWENSFYESGESIADRIRNLCLKVPDNKIQEIAIKARNEQYLRHIPLFLTREMTRKGSKLVADTLYEIIQRADELAEFLAMYWKDGKTPVSAQVKKGLARAFTKFNEYQLAKYNRNNAVKLKDVLFMCHAKPKDKVQEETWKKLINGTLNIPDTWETNLSAGANKKETFTRLMQEEKLGALAFLRNMRNMIQADVDPDIMKSYMSIMKPAKVLPFRFISASKYAPKYEPELEKLMLKCLAEKPKLSGNTVLLVDVSGSMDIPVSNKSDITRLEAACGVAMLLREICEEIDIYSFSMKLKQIPARHGFALKDAIIKSQNHSGTPLGLAVKSIYADKNFNANEIDFGRWDGRYKVEYQGQGLKPDRLIVITDEQSHDPVSNPVHGKGYMINVASYQNSVGYGPWTHVDGWSESVIDYIMEYEKFIIDTEK